MSFSSHFPFFVLVDKVTKNKNRLRDFLYYVFRLQGKTGKTKIKNNKKQTNYYVIFSFFVTFVNQNEKWNEKLINIDLEWFFPCSNDKKFLYK